MPVSKTSKEGRSRSRCTFPTSTTTGSLSSADRDPHRRTRCSSMKPRVSACVSACAKPCRGTPTARSTCLRALGQRAAACQADFTPRGSIVRAMTMDARTMRLLEREELLAQLQAHWRAAGLEAGRLVVVEGEAGIGKTTLMRSFAQSLATDVPVLWGACDALSTPRPLGPLHDMLDGVLPGEADADRHVLFVKFLETLAVRPTLAVLE